MAYEAEVAGTVGAELAPILEDLADGAYKPHIHAIYDFDEVKSAVEEMASPRVIGKIALVSPLGRQAL